MRAFTRKPQPQHDALIANAIGELIVVDETDTLTPIHPTAQHPALVDEPQSSVVAVESPLDDEALAAYRSLMRFASADVPQVGWRRAMFVVSGIVLGPGRAERELRAQVLLLLSGVRSLVIDATKEAAP